MVWREREKRCRTGGKSCGRELAMPWIAWYRKKDLTDKVQKGQEKGKSLDMFGLGRTIRWTEWLYEVEDVNVPAAHVVMHLVHLISIRRPIIHWCIRCTSWPVAQDTVSHKSESSLIWWIRKQTIYKLPNLYWPKKRKQTKVPKKGKQTNKGFIYFLPMTCCFLCLYGYWCIRLYENCQKYQASCQIAKATNIPKNPSYLGEIWMSSS